jgi:hypothetical protein
MPRPPPARKRRVHPACTPRAQRRGRRGRRRRRRAPARRSPRGGRSPSCLRSVRMTRAHTHARAHARRWRVLRRGCLASAHGPPHRREEQGASLSGKCADRGLLSGKRARKSGAAAGADGRARTERAGGDDLARHRPAEELARHHLVVAHARACHQRAGRTNQGVATLRRVRCVAHARCPLRGVTVAHALRLQRVRDGRPACASAADWPTPANAHARRR